MLRSSSFFVYNDTTPGVSKLRYLAIYDSADGSNAKYAKTLGSDEFTNGLVEVEQMWSAETVDFALQAASHYLPAIYRSQPPVSPVETYFKRLFWIFKEKRMSVSWVSFQGSIFAYPYL
jgi:hypothetical protein